MRGLFLILFLLAPAVSAAVEIKVGAMPINIPPPPGFSPVTPEMSNLHEALQEHVASMNIEHVSFIPESAVPVALSGEIPQFPRRFSVQTVRSRIHDIFKDSDFARLKELIKTQNHDVMQDIERHNPDMLQNFMDYAEGRKGAPLDFSTIQMIPFPAHEETDRTLSYSVMAGFNRTDETGQTVPSVNAGTATVALVKGKILYLFTFAHASDIAWSQDASRQWVNEVVLANQNIFDNKIIYWTLLAVLLLYIFVTSLKKNKAR